MFYPIQFTRLQNLVDVSVTVDAGGSSSQAGAIRYALSVCLKSFVDKGWGSNHNIDHLRMILYLKLFLFLAYH